MRYLCSVSSKYDINFNLPNQNGYKPFHSVVGMMGRLQIVQYVVENADLIGVDLNEPNADGWTPFHIASKNGNTEVVSYLMDNSKLKNINVAAVNDQWYSITPFMASCRFSNCNPQTVQLYLKRADDLGIDFRTVRQFPLFTNPLSLNPLKLNPQNSKSTPICIPK